VTFPIRERKGARVGGSRHNAGVRPPRVWVVSDRLDESKDERM
jgi:hypothetical protein